MKIAAYAIAKNEEKNIPNFLKAIRDFDEVVVVDTGSTDNTFSLLKKAGVRVVQKTFEPFDFSEARNFSLSLVSSDVDWCLSLDFNEYFLRPWKVSFLQALKQRPEATIFEVIRYDDYGDEGGVRKGLENKRIFHSHDGYRWKFAVHEHLEFGGDGVELIIPCGIEIAKRIDRSRLKEDFYAEIAVRESEKHPRESHYLWFLAVYHHERKHWEEVVEYGTRYIDATASARSDFRVYAFCMLGNAFEALGKSHQAFHCGMLALGEALFFPEYPVFAFAARHLKDYGSRTGNVSLKKFIHSLGEKMC